MRSWLERLISCLPEEDDTEAASHDFALCETTDSETESVPAYIKIELLLQLYKKMLALLQTSSP
jgi:hypothetical protein